MIQELAKHIFHSIGHDFDSTPSVDSTADCRRDIYQRPYIINPIWLLTGETGTQPRQPLRKQRKFSAKSANFGANVACDFFVTGDQKRYPNYLFCSPSARSYYYIAQMDKSRSLARRGGYIVRATPTGDSHSALPPRSNDNPTDSSSHTAAPSLLLANTYQGIGQELKQYWQQLQD